MIMYQSVGQSINQSWIKINDQASKQENLTIEEAVIIFVTWNISMT